MTYCPSVCRYRVTFSDGTIIYPELPGHVDVKKVGMAVCAGDINERERAVGNRTGH